MLLKRLSLPRGQEYQSLRKVTLLMVGLHNAGKTAIARVVKGESSTDVVPTMGISRIDLRHENCDVTLFDLGGGKKTRETWKYYFGESYGLIFVVDSSNLNNIQASKEAIYEIVKHPRMMGKPVLILANKQDKEGALSEECLIKELALEQLATEQKCVCQIKTCSAMTGTGKKRDAKIICGFDWILGYIQNNYEKLKVQVERDTKTLEICWQNTERDNQMREPKKTENPEFYNLDPFDATLFAFLNPQDIRNTKKKRFCFIRPKTITSNNLSLPAPESHKSSGPSPSEPDCRNESKRFWFLKPKRIGPHSPATGTNDFPGPSHSESDICGNCIPSLRHTILHNRHRDSEDCIF